MRTARICEKWNLDFNIELKDEGDRNLHKRSYLHYATSRPDLVACKSYATEWLFKGIVDETKEYTAIEYMAGIGIQTIIAQNTFKLSNHTVNELDEGCIDHLSNSNFPLDLKVLGHDARKLLRKGDHYDLKFLDFPSSSILRVTREWNSEFAKLFQSKPRMVVWTDTSITYSMKINGHRYAEITGVETKTNDDYVNGYSKWLFENHGYSIVKAAFRHRNAVYFAAVEGLHETESRYFKLKDTNDGFYFLDKQGVSLEQFM